MKDDKILLIPSEENHKHYPDHHHAGHHRHMRRKFCFIGTVMAATVFISYIIVLVCAKKYKNVKTEL